MRAPLVVLVLGLPVLAAAERAETLRSYWNEDHTAILSDVVVTRDDGTTETRQVLGGSVDGVGMVQFPLHDRPTAIRAFVPQRSNGAAPLRWNGSCVFITPDSAGSSHVTAEELSAAIAGALQAWNGATESCSYLRFMLEPPGSHEVGPDGKNIIKFRDESWCRPDRCATKPYDPSAVAITTLFYIDRRGRLDDGLILDADIEMNALHYAFAVGCETQCVTSSPRRSIQDLENTLVHELGHAIGLDHTCWDERVADFPPLDAEGNIVPSCEPKQSLSAAIVEATMYNFTDPQEIKKRTPEADDVSGVCTNYPRSADPEVCEPVALETATGCCAVSGARRPRDLLGGALVFALLLGLRARACSRSRRR